MKYILILMCLLIAKFSNGDQSKYDSYFRKEMLTSSFLKSHISTEYVSKTGKKVYVFDDVISYSHLITSRMFFSINDGWRYVLFDKFVQDPNGKFNDGNGIPWKSWQDPTAMSGTRLGNMMKAMATTASMNSTSSPYAAERPREFQLIEVYSAITRRGDIATLHSDVAPSRDNEAAVEAYTILIYTNTLWRKNSYGEILFYEDNDDFDIFSVISPRCGRIVMWDSTIRYLIRSPSITELSALYMIFARFHSDPKVIFERRTAYDNHLMKVEKEKDEFVCTEDVDKVPILNLNEHLVLKRSNKDRHFVAVFDGLFNSKDLDALRTYTVKYGKYFYDDHLDISSDNVQWIAGFEVAKFVQSRFWPVIKQVATFVSGKDTWYPYDVACNLIRSTDQTRIHRDVSRNNEEEMTFLLYLNPNWTAEYYGETAFMESRYDSPDNDFVAEVVPLYGRAVIFDGKFPHSAHPPAPDYPGPRYTFAVKLSATKLEAVQKTMYEETRHSVESVDESIMKLKYNPVMYGAVQKLKVVSSYLQTKQIQSLLEENPLTEEIMHKEGESQDSEDNHRETMILSLLQDESVVALNNKNKQLLLSMAKHHGIYEMMEKAGGQEETKNVSTPQESPVVPRHSANFLWKKYCRGNADCFADYTELLLKQQRELLRRTVRDTLAII